MDLNSIKTKVAFGDSFDGQLGVAYDVLTPERVTGRVDVTPTTLGSHGVVPLGVYTAIAEGSASMGTAAGVLAGGMIAVGLSNDTTITGDVRDGHIDFEARPDSRAEDLWVWNVKCVDATGASCALSRVLIAVRPGR